MTSLADVIAGLKASTGVVRSSITAVAGDGSLTVVVDGVTVAGIRRLESYTAPAAGHQILLGRLRGRGSAYVVLGRII